MINPWLDLEVLVLLAAANGAPVLAKKLLGPRYSRPLDAGRTFWDGHRLLGDSKTIRGIVFSLLATPCCSISLGLGLSIGLIASVGAMLGDLFSSFVKRRLGRPPSSQAFGLDQIPESFLPALLLVRPVGLTLGDVCLIVVAFIAGELVLSRILFRWHIRDEPY